MAVRLIDAGILQDNLTDIYGDGNRLVYAWCGAPMTDEAVEMVMERLEALHHE